MKRLRRLLPLCALALTPALAPAQGPPAPTQAPAPVTPPLDVAAVDAVVARTLKAFDVRGYKEVSHTGGEIGMVTKVLLLPELCLGIIVLTNQESGAAFTAVANAIEDHYLGVTGLDRVQEGLDREKKYKTDDDKVTAAAWQQVALAQKAAPKKPDYAPYLGRYHDAWLGDVLVYQQGLQLWLRAVRSPRLVGELLPTAAAPTPCAGRPAA